MSDEWYYIDAQGNQQGPVNVPSLKQLFQGKKINGDSFCWSSSIPDWAAIKDVPGLMDKLQEAPAPAPAPVMAKPAIVLPFGPGQSPFANLQRPAPTAAATPVKAATPVVASPSPTPAASSASATAAAISAMAARPQAPGKLEPLGAPEPVSTGAAAQPLTIVRKDGPAHGWKALKSADGQEYYYNTQTGQTQWDKPDVLKTSDDYERAGEWFWAPHDVHGYVPARKVGDNGGKVLLETEDGQSLSFAGKQALALEPMKWLQLKQLQSDLVMLDVMNKPLILYNLKKRFEQNEIYTSIGTILISLNPYKRLPLYTPAVMEEYIRRGNRKLPPHVFLIADDAYKQLLENRVGQSIVISGESGAGKTECTKQALQYLAEIAGSSTSNVEQKILASNPILEAFGNAKTVRNNNSSRFGKYVEIYFDNRAQISGSTNTNYLLEKIRVVKQSNGERNYHAFYQLCRGATAQQRQQLHLEDVSQYWYLSQSGCDTVEDMDDAEEHEAVLQAMHELGWSQQEIDQLYRTLSGILHLGNVKFRSVGDRQCEVTTPEALQRTCTLLEIDPTAFHKAVTQRVMRIQGQADIDVPLGKEEAEAARDALAKFIYEKMFDWIVQRINISIGKGSNAQQATISILDIFGFEIFEHNQFEQLCINYTNEKLQQFFNQHTFKKEEELYRFEGINFTHVQYIDNQPVLDLIEQRPVGVLPCVDEEIRMPKGSDKTFVQKLINNHQRNPHFKQYLKNPDCFIIEHYAGTVRYDSTGFLEKNRDQLNEDAIGVLLSSRFAFLKNLFSDNSSANKKISLGSKFAKQLTDLMTALNQTEPHYIRCVKPNPNKAPMQFYGAMSLEQLQYAGVFEAVTIRKQGFPFRLTHNEFFRRYKCLFKDKQWDNRVIENCKFLINSMGLDLSQVQIGSTRVLYRAEQHRVMELKRNLAVEEVTIYAQKYCRRVLVSLLKDRCIKYKPVLKAAIDTRSIEEVDKALAQAGAIGFPIYELKQAQRFKFVFMEEKRLEQLFVVLVHQDAQENFEAFKSAVASADDIELQSAGARQVREMYYAAKRVRDQVTEDAVKQEKVLDEVEMKGIIERADNLPGFSCEAVERLRTLLYNTSEDNFVKMQLKAAVQLKDPELIQARTIRMKDLVLDKSGSLFQFQNFPSLHPPQAWADFKLLCWDREELAAGMLKWTPNAIHAPLTQIDPLQKEVISAAKRLFKNVQGFMGDKKQQQPVMLLVELLTECLRQPLLRDEVYCQVIKQLHNNPSPDSVHKGWNLMLCYLHCCPPSTMLENYLQMFFRTSAIQPRKYINLMHKTMYSGARTNFPTESDINQWIAQQESLDCDDYKTKLAKAEARMRAAQQQMQQPAPQSRNGFGFASAAVAATTTAAAPAVAARPAPAAPARPTLPVRAPPAAPAAPEGPPAHLQWHFIGADGTQQGPVDKNAFRAAFKRGDVAADSYCWNETMDGWQVITDVTLLYDFLKF